MSDLERRIAALEKGVSELSFVGAKLDWTPFQPEPAENTSQASPENQLAELERQWHTCNIVGQGVLVQGSMSEGWALAVTGEVDGSSLSGELDSGGDPPPAPVFYTDIVFADAGDPAGLNIVCDAAGWVAL